MGHEGVGLSDGTLALCDEVVTIEMMQGIKSFNAGVASSIMMYKKRLISTLYYADRYYIIALLDAI